MTIESLCVFCGSKEGKRPEYAEVARQLGKILAEKGITLVYGGGHVGIMGAVADAALSEGGDVIGVIPRALVELEVGHQDLSHLYVVENMHQRKAKMAEMAQGFIVLPGGIGTMEEFFEIFTWAQLGFHRKPFGLINVDGYYDGLLSLLGHMVEEGFVYAQDRERLAVSQDPADLLLQLESYRAPEVEKRVDEDDLG